MNQATINHQKALIANTDLASAQVFTYQLAEYNLAIILAGKSDNVFLSIKQTMLDIENQIKQYQGPVSSLFTHISHNLTKNLSYLSDFETLLIAWASDVLYLQRNGSSQSDIHLPQAFLFRSDHLEPLPFAAQNHLISGYIKPGDRVLLSNSGLLVLLQNTTNSNEAITLLANASPDTLQDVLSSLSIDQEHEPPVAILQLEVAHPITTINQTEPRSKPTRQLKLLAFNLSRRHLMVFLLATFVVGIGFAAISLFLKPKTSTPAPVAVQDATSSASLPSNIHQVTDWPVLVSLDLIKDKFTPNHFSFSDGNLLMLDDKQKSLISFNLSQKNPTVLGGQKQLGDPQFASSSDDSAFAYAPSKGVVKINLKSQKNSLAAPKSPEWGTIVDVFAFGSNFYLLDSTKSNVWKYVPTESGYSNPQSYFKEGVVTSFPDARKLQIDSSIWILKGVDEILKYTSGSQDFYGLSDFPENLKTITSFFVSSDTDNVYLLDSNSQAVFVTSKQGKFIASYKGDKFKDAIDIFADEKSNLLYIIDSQKIYQIPLN